MSLNCLLTARQRVLPCLVMLITSSVIAGEPSPVSNSIPGCDTATKATADPFVGGYKRKTVSASKTRATVGAYYFDGWAGNSDRWRDDPAWTKLHPPTHLTKRMIEEFADREPIWGWRDDKLEIMERQIDLAADHGIAFFAFCWYWNNDRKKLAEDPKHVGLNLFLKARNNHRLKFCLLVANHQGYLIQGEDEWRKAAEGWLPSFKHPQHITVDG